MGAALAKFRCETADIEAAVRECHSVAQVLRRLKLRVAGSNYATLKRFISERNLDVSHWTGQGHRRGSKVPVVPARPLVDVLRRNSIVNSHKLRRRLIRAGLLAPRCCVCKLSEWLGLPISLELDHIDGDRNNQELPNLRLLCPNCHAQTPTYRGRNRRGRRNAKLLPGASDMMASLARVVELVDTRDLIELSPPVETPEVKPVKVGESPGTPS